MPIQTPAAVTAARQAADAIARRRERLIASPLDRAGRESLARADSELARLVAASRIDPCDASAEVPLVLLPVRIETRFDARRSVLRVRITPDEIHLDGLRRTLTEGEREAGIAYWTTLWSEPTDPANPAGPTNATNATDPATAAAWGLLVEAVGLRRAGWVAQALRPSNVAARASEEPLFQDDPVEVSAGMVARCLPDRFVVRVFPAGLAAITVTGAAVARDLPISPIALTDDALVEAGRLKVPAGSEWAVDFAAAVQAGLGVEVPLPAGVNRIDCVVVTGTRNAVSEDQNAADLADLLLSHRYGDGASLLAWGTPTNNAEADRSPYRPDEAAAAPPLEPSPASVDAIATATLLGLPADTIESLIDPAAPRSTLAVTQTAANTALWYATWGPVLDQIDGTDIAGVTPATIESARRLHRESVRGAGHSPSLRLGAQVYGLLPVADLESWKPRSGELGASLAPLVRRLLARWAARAGSLPRVGPGDEVADSAMLEMMGTQPISTSVRARPAVDGPQLQGLAAATGAEAGRLTAERQLGQAMLAQYSVELARRLVPPSVHAESRLIALPLVSERDATVIADILADRSPQVDSVLQAMLDLAWDEAKNRRSRAAPGPFVPPLLTLLGADTRVSAMVKSATADAPMATTIASAVASVNAIVDPTGNPTRNPTRPIASPEDFRTAAATLRATSHFAGQPTEPLSLGAFEPVAQVGTSLAQVALDLGDTAEARWLGQTAIASVLDIFAARWEMHDAMVTLGAAPLAERRVAVASALDLASHRVDAWATGIVADRQRSLAPEGMTLGAFGYVENLTLGEAGREPQGWLQAPSQAHAVTAGLLASAHRSNIGARAGRQPFAIDLTSRRGPELRRVLEGIRAGQSIGALLGYQIERGLIGSAARFQLSLRELAPLDPDTLGTGLPVGERTARVAAAAVVDGQELLQQFWDAAANGPAAALRTTLAARPANAFVEQWDPISDSEWATVAAALRGAAETLDAVSDALLAESVLQYASGNAARASAAMDAAASGGAVDPELGVLGVRQAGRVLTHAVFALIPEDITAAAAGADGWTATRPRALAEPRLEAWAARRLGAPADIIVADDGAGRLSLADAGFAALDLVFADDLRALERDLRAALPALADRELCSNPDPGWPAGARSIVAAATLAGSLRSLVAGATPLQADRLARSGASPQHRSDSEELLARCEALLDALEHALAAGAEIIGRIDPDARSIAEDQVSALREALAPLAAFGVPLVPDPEIPTHAAWALGAWQAASARWVAARALLDQLRAPQAEPPNEKQRLDTAQAIAEGVLGDGFRLLPILRRLPEAAVDSDIRVALERPAFAAPARARISAFVRDHATVRAGVGRLAEAQLIGRALGRPIDLEVIQLTDTNDDGSPAPGTDRWLAGPLPDDQPWPAGPAVHAVIERLGSLTEANDNIAGVLFDSWVEALPFQPDPRAFAEQADPNNPLRAARATTALAIHAHQASARAPQAILSAVSGDGRRWTTDSVVRTVRAAVDLAKARLVTYENLPGDAAVLPAIYLASPWLQGRRSLTFAELARIEWTRVAYPFLSEQK